MKTYAFLLLLAAAVAVIFSGCKTCSPCLADGQSFELPVTPGQTVTYVNDSNIEKTFSVRLFGNWPAEEYCGRVGSGSYGKCGATMTGCLEDSQDSLAICFQCSTAYNDDVEQNVYRLMGVGRKAGTAMWIISVNNNVVESKIANSTVTKINSISIHGKQYTNVYEYQHSSAGINECTELIYSPEYGVLKFSVRLANSVENLVLVR